MNNTEIAQLGLIKQAAMEDIIQSIKQWIDKNPEAAQRIGGGAAGTVLGAGAGGLMGGGKGALLGGMLGMGGGAAAGPQIMELIKKLRSGEAGGADAAVADPQNVALPAGGKASGEGSYLGIPEQDGEGDILGGVGDDILANVATGATPMSDAFQANRAGIQDKAVASAKDEYEYSNDAKSKGAKPSGKGATPADQFAKRSSTMDKVNAKSDADIAAMAADPGSITGGDPYAGGIKTGPSMDFKDIAAAQAKAQNKANAATVHQGGLGAAKNAIMSLGVPAVNAINSYGEAAGAKGVAAQSKIGDVLSGLGGLAAKPINALKAKKDAWDQMQRKGEGVLATKQMDKQRAAMEANPSGDVVID